MEFNKRQINALWDKIKIAVAEGIRKTTTVDELKTMIANGELTPGAIYSYDVVTSRGVMTINKQALSGNKLDDNGYITSEDEKYNGSEVRLGLDETVNIVPIDKTINILDENINITEPYAGEQFYFVTNQYLNSFDIDSLNIFIRKNNDCEFYSYTDNKDLYSGGIVLAIKNNTIIDKFVEEDDFLDGESDWKIGDKINIYTIGANLDSPSFHISTIHIDQSYIKDSEHVLITGDVAVEKDENGEIIFLNNYPKVKDFDENVISWIRENTKLFASCYDFDRQVMRLQPIPVNAKADYYNSHNISMKLPEFWWKIRNSSNSNCFVDFCKNKKYIDDSWNHWDGNTIIDSNKITELYDLRSEQLENYSEITNGANNTQPVTLEWMKGTGNRVNYSFNSWNVVSSFNAGNNKPLVNISQKQFKELARNTDIPGLTLIKYETHCLLALLFYAYYGDTDSQKICGHGENIVGHYMSLVTTGMVDTIKGKTDTKSTKFWGLIDWWGNVYEWMDDLVILSYRNVSGENPYGENTGEETYNKYCIGILNDDGTIKRVIRDVPYFENGYSQMILGEHFDLFNSDSDCFDHYNATPLMKTILENKDLEYENGQGWAASAGAGSDPGGVAARSCDAGYPGGGVAYLYVGDDPDYADSDYGSRLQYHGPWVIVDSFDNN